MAPIKVLVHGAVGRMGAEVLGAVCADPELLPVAAVDLKADRDRLPLPDGSGKVPFSSDVESLLGLTAPDVLVDFTTASATMPAARAAARHRVGLVIGTTGLTEQDLQEIERLCQEGGIGAVVAPNFALGAVLLIELARIAARFFDWAEIIELHHERKIDAPSGTALATARALLEARGRPFSFNTPEKETLAGTRGGELGGVRIHSVRLPGLMAHQEVILGGRGQTLSLRHDTIGRECYLPGVILAIKKVVGLRGLVYGLDKLLGFGEEKP